MLFSASLLKFIEQQKLARNAPQEWGHGEKRRHIARIAPPLCCRGNHLYFPFFWGNWPKKYCGSSATGHHLAGDLFVAHKGTAEELRSCFEGARGLGEIWHLVLVGVTRAGGHTRSGGGAWGGEGVKGGSRARIFRRQGGGRRGVCEGPGGTNGPEAGP